ncbi:MAG TPA: ice-binding family protein [Verrucomicrobiae bacterium]|nr:ice-binding family protein [Verrucomicrobiae bacterium]
MNKKYSARIKSATEERIAATKGTGNFAQTAAGTFAKFLPLGLGLALGVVFLPQNVTAIPVTVDLGSDASFAVLAGSGITVAGAVNTTTITGDIGTFPTTSITGLGNVVLNGANQAGNAVTQNAKNDLVTAFNDAAGRPATTTYAPVFDLGGLTLKAGVYNDPSSFGLTGTLRLNAQGDPNAVFIFQTGSTLITASHSAVQLIGGAQACHVFWEVGSSATLGTDTDFAGNILALASITLDTGATLDGRLLAENGAVTLDDNTITKAVCSSDTGGTTSSVPDNGNTLLLLGSGLAGLFVFQRRFVSPASRPFQQTIG